VSAVAFFIAVKLQKELGIPVAFIDEPWVCSHWSFMQFTGEAET